MTPEFEAKLKKFKPEFGNTDHIYVLEMIAKLRKKEILIDKLSATSKALKNQLEELKRIEHRILIYLK